MKLSCPIVRDLLPLYAENLASAQSRDAVEAHLQDCPACRKLLADMKTDFCASPVTETRPLLRIRREFRAGRLSRSYSRRRERSRSSAY